MVERDRERGDLKGTSGVDLGTLVLFHGAEVPNHTPIPNPNPNTKVLNRPTKSVNEL